MTTGFLAGHVSLYETEVTGGKAAAGSPQHLRSPGGKARAAGTRGCWRGSPRQGQRDPASPKCVPASAQHFSAAGSEARAEMNQRHRNPSALTATKAGGQTLAPAEPRARRRPSKAATGSFPLAISLLLVLLRLSSLLSASDSSRSATHRRIARARGEAAGTRLGSAAPASLFDGAETAGARARFPHTARTHPRYAGHPGTAAGAEAATARGGEAALGPRRAGAEAPRPSGRRLRGASAPQRAATAPVT